MQKLIKVKTTETLGCKFVSSWEIEKGNSLGNCTESEKALYIFQKSLELEKSDAPFKDTIISYINLLHRGMGRLFVTEHSRTLDIHLGVSHATSVSINHYLKHKTTKAETLNYFLSSMMTLYLIVHFCKNFSRKQLDPKNSFHKAKIFQREKFLRTSTP